MICGRCELEGRKDEKTKQITKFIPGDGPQNSDLMLIGRNPGKQENRQGKPFVGAAGYLLNQLLNQADLNRNDIYVTNLVKCYTPGDRPPTKKEIQLCLPILFQEIKEVQPKLIIGVGGEVLSALGQKKGIMNWRGSAWFDDELGCIFMVTLHPSYLQRGQRQFIPVVVADFRKAKRLLRDGWRDPEYTYITDPEEAERWYKENFSPVT